MSSPLGSHGIAQSKNRAAVVTNHKVMKNHGDLAVRRVLRRYPPGHCRKCGYNLTGNVSGKCSECGTEIMENEK